MHARIARQRSPQRGATINASRHSFCNRRPKRTRRLLRFPQHLPGIPLQFRLQRLKKTQESNLSVVGFGHGETPRRTSGKLLAEESRLAGELRQNSKCLFLDGRQPLFCGVQAIAVNPKTVSRPRRRILPACNLCKSTGGVSFARLPPCRRARIDANLAGESRYSR